MNKESEQRYILPGACSARAKDTSEVRKCERRMVKADRRIAVSCYGGLKSIPVRVQERRPLDGSVV